MTFALYFRPPDLLTTWICFLTWLVNLSLESDMYYYMHRATFLRHYSRMLTFVIYWVVKSKLVSLTVFDYHVVASHVNNKNNNMDLSFDIVNERLATLIICSRAGVILMWNVDDYNILWKFSEISQLLSLGLELMTSSLQPKCPINGLMLLVVLSKYILIC